RDRGRAHREPGAHALHHAGHLSAVRPPRRTARAPPRARTQPRRTAGDRTVSLSSPFVRRPVGTTLLTIALVIAGTISFRLLPVAPLPQVDFPTISVVAGLPGASPETMASAVATPLERQFGRIAGVTEMTSVSFLGATTIALQFDLTRDINGAARDVQSALARYGVGLDEVRQALAAANVNRPKGQLDDGRFTWEINATDQLREPARYEPLIVAWRNGAPVRLMDVARVHGAVEDLRAGAVS